MTRETKIGLLVGLAFIIVIGILLSDHINNSTEPAAAALDQTFKSVQRSVDAPDARNQGITTVVTPPSAVIPQSPVATSREPLPANNGSSVVVIGPGTDPSSLPRPARPVVEPQPNGNGVQVLPPNNTDLASNTNDPPTGGVATAPDTAVSGPLADLVRNHSGELTGAGAGPVKPTPNGAGGTPPAAPHAPVTLPPGVRQVKAEEGDTVTKLAIKYMGGNSKANREAIIRANPNMGPDGHKLFAGQTYLIPAPVAGTATPASAGPVVVSSEQPLQPAPAPKPAPRASPAQEEVPPGVTMYTVKENDSLWKIASEQLGSGARCTEIRDLNPDVLKGSDAVRPGMRIKLPPKAVASSN